MKKILNLILSMMVVLVSYSQAPSNDCGENATLINQCGTSFSITQAQMALATDDAGCSVGGSCPINYVNGQAYENFDCDVSTGGTGGDDFNGSIENSVWWTFTPQESCDYDVTINITNCCCKDKGSTNAAQYQIFDADGVLPGGTIQNNMAYQTGVTGTFTETISVTNGNPVYILLDGLNGTDCDISVSILPTASCTGCVIALPIELIEFDGEYDMGNVNLFWASASEANNEYYTVERSLDGYEWDFLCNVDGAGNSNQNMVYRYTDKDVPSIKYIYYRLSQTDFNGDSETFKIISVITPKIKNPKVIGMYDFLGKEISESDLESYQGFYIIKYEDGTSKKMLKD